MGFMASGRTILEFLLGAAGPVDIVVTPDGAGVRVRLPNQRSRRPTALGWLIAALVIGPFVAVIARDAMWIAVGLTLAAALVIALWWRFVWHYEILLTRRSLRVDHVTTLWRTCRATVDLQRTRQFTIVRIGKECRLHAESPTAATRPFFRNQNYDRMRQLAAILVEQHALLTPGGPALRVAVEQPHEANEERTEPPLNSQIALTQPGAGITLEFLLPQDDRLDARRRAWRAFEIAIILLVGAVIWFVVCKRAEWPSLLLLAYIMFMIGIGTLIASANQSWAAWQNNQVDDEVRQLSVVGNMLIRTSRDHRKKAWYRSEIRTIRADVLTGHSSSEGGAITVSYCLKLILELHNGEMVNLLPPKEYEPRDDYRPRAEFEWVATRLRQALLESAGEPEETDASSQAIKEMPAWIKET